MTRSKRASKAERFAAYKVRYLGFLEATAATQLMSRVAEEVFSRFPHSLPGKHQKRADALLRGLSNAFREAVDASTKAGQPTSVPIRGARGQFASSVLTLVLARGLGRGTSLLNAKFPYRSRAQELVMLFSHLDAFMSDSLRAVCEERPEVLKRAEPTLSTEDVISAGSWDALMSRLIERRMYAFGMKSTREQILSFERDLGLKIKIEEEVLSGIDGAEPVRHVIVHNNCRVSQEFKRRMPKSKLKIGGLVPISRKLVLGVASAAVTVSSETLLAVGEKFFEVDPTTVTGVLRRGQ